MRQIRHVLENGCAHLALAWSRELKLVVPALQQECDAQVAEIAVEWWCAFIAGRRYLSKGLQKRKR